jgi:hypothetical protein
VNTAPGKVPPGEKEGMAIARIVTNALDTTKFDPLLVRSAARGVVKSLDMMCQRIDNLVSHASSRRNFELTNHIR